MSEWFETCDGLSKAAWEHIALGVADKTHPARHPTFSTVSTDGWPESRTVVLRAASAKEWTLEIHTDVHSDKVTSLRTNPRAALHVWVETARLQIRLQTFVEIRSGEEVADAWAKVPDPSRQAYGITPAPGSPIKGALDYAKSPDQSTFAVLSCAVHRMDLVHLGQVHRRARFTQARDWNGEWLAP